MFRKIKSWFNRNNTSVNIMDPENHPVDFNKVTFGTCIICDKSLEGIKKYKNRLYCSDKCRAVAYKERHSKKV